ncbi:uncharacterized protein [Physcomitrium patens]|uniref:uncharacterized protein isoform X2 n=1 Tax=Physcomitrium patens TaxID=3218 RepID=UPI000D15B3E3|nr:uncharacterized protein LOC112295822 isoform X2 [Physcomitrium patens]|eukprot:XP_024403571.1 uncharacterized protein LOC112295822 isoform X2 [Physcomitrella patens]
MSASCDNLLYSRLNSLGALLDHFAADAFLPFATPSHSIMTGEEPSTSSMMGVSPLELDGAPFPTFEELQLINEGASVAISSGAHQMNDHGVSKLHVENETATTSSGDNQMLIQEPSELPVGYVTATTYVGNRSSCLPLVHGVPCSNGGRLKRPDVGRLQVEGNRRQKDIILPNQPLNRSQSFYANRRKIDAEEAGSKGMGTAAVSCERRQRSRNWSNEEKDSFLIEMENAVGKCNGKVWDSISKALLDGYKFERSAKSCEDLWGTLRKEFKASKFSQVFPERWYETMERILAAQEKKKRSKAKEKQPGSKSRGMVVQESRGDEGDNEWCESRVRQGSRALDIHPEHIGSRGPMSKFKKPWCQQDGEEARNDAVDRIKDVIERIFQHPDHRRTPDSITKKDCFMAVLSPLLKQMEQQAANEDHLISEIVPVIKDLIREELQLLLRPAVSALLDVEQNEQDFQAKLRAIEDERRALDLKEAQIKRQRVGRL